MFWFFKFYQYMPKKKITKIQNIHDPSVVYYNQLHVLMDYSTTKYNIHCAISTIIASNLIDNDILNDSSITCIIKYTISITNTITNCCATDCTKIVCHDSYVAAVSRIIIFKFI